MAASREQLGESFEVGSSFVCDAIDIQLGKRLRRRRRLLGLTQQELAMACGMRMQQIHKYESAANRMSASILCRLANALEVDAGYFFAGLIVADSPYPAASRPTAESRAVA